MKLAEQLMPTQPPAPEPELTRKEKIQRMKKEREEREQREERERLESRAKKLGGEGRSEAEWCVEYGG